MKRILWLLLLAPVLPAFAVIPQFWEIRTYDQFRQGEMQGVSVTGDGRLVLAPSFDLAFDTGDLIVFSAATDSQGNVYVGTGHDGKVYKVDREGNGSLLADLAELDVLALAVGDDDTLFAATAPNGKVYRIAAGGSAEVFFDPGARYIWALLFDASSRLLVATGEDGVIYRVDPNGESEVFFDSEETHILTMAMDPSGNVIAGGDPKGYIYRISDSGQAFVLYDSGMREVRSVAIAEDGAVYAAVLSSGGGVPTEAPDTVSAFSLPGPPVSLTGDRGQPGFAAQSVQMTAGPAAPTGRGGGPPGGSGSGSQSLILEIAPEGAVTRIWESDDEMVFALLPTAGGLWFSTGANGRIYSLSPPERPTLLLESTEEQTTRLLKYGDRIFAASANAGKLFEIGSGAGVSGSYQSTVRNTGATSSWGRVAWAGRGVEILTRSGNTSSPDQTWSDWAPLGPDGAVMSPNARFIQWRAVFGSDRDERPMLSSLRLPYLQQNFRPEIRSVEVLRPGIAIETLPTANNNAGVPSAVGVVSGRVLPATPRASTRTVVRPGAHSLTWAARDENDDVLIYSIFYRAENEAEWKLLVEGLTDSFYTVPPDTLPDGMYVFRIVASDIGSNPPELALAGLLDTIPFAIDRTPPVVTVEERSVENGRVTLDVEARDETSTLKQAEISVNAGPWRPVFPVDGIIDSQSETFEFSSDELDSGEHVFAFRIYDQNENVGIGKAVVRIP